MAKLELSEAMSNALNVLREEARMHATNQAEADNIVERVLLQAITAIPDKAPSETELLPWLQSFVIKALQ
jgi:hypothetical protein